MSKKVSLLTRWVGVAAVAWLMAACAVVPSGPPEEIVAARAKARWEALIAKRWGDAYGYLTPSIRGVMSQERYVSRFTGPIEWLGAEVISVTCKDADACTATIRIRHRLLLPRWKNDSAETGYEENWIREDGRWWYYEKL